MLSVIWNLQVHLKLIKTNLILEQLINDIY